MFHLAHPYFLKSPFSEAPFGFDSEMLRVLKVMILLMLIVEMIECWTDKDLILKCSVFS